ncbi:MAG: hypothetical protein VX589_00930 [Myxococcota bacterium]|nr:hypothetical protein [Myxococcota bacterium]
MATAQVKPTSAAEKTGASTTTPIKLAKNALNLELGGLGILYAINDERTFREQVAMRVGLMYFAFELDSGELDSSGTTMKVNFSLTMMPIVGTYLVKNKGGRRHLELGGGPTPVVVSASNFLSSDSDFAFYGDSGVILSSTVGYRYEPFTAGAPQFRIGANPQYLLGEFFLGGSRLT